MKYFARKFNSRAKENFKNTSIDFHASYLLHFFKFFLVFTLCLKANIGSKKNDPSSFLKKK